MAIQKSYTHMIIATLFVEKEEQEEEIRKVNVITFYMKPFFLSSKSVNICVTAILWF